MTFLFYISILMTTNCSNLSSAGDICKPEYFPLTVLTPFMCPTEKIEGFFNYSIPNMMVWSFCTFDYTKEEIVQAHFMGS